MGIKSLAARVLYPYGKTRHVLRGPVRGMRYTVEPGMGLTYAWNPALMNFEFLKDKLGPGDTVFDIGANKGQMALFFAAQVGAAGVVHSFEPAPNELKCLERNLRLNSLATVRVWPFAVSDSDGYAVFTYDRTLPTQGKLENVEPLFRNTGKEPQHFSVETRKLDTIMKESAGSPSMLKIDVEGAAGAVLRGGDQLLREVGPNIYVELHGPEEQGSVRDQLRRQGYTIENILGQDVTERDNEWHSPLWCYRHSTRRRP